MSDQPRIIMSTGCLFNLPLKRCARIAAQAGFDGLELIMNETELCDHQSTAGQTMDCPVLSLHAPFRHWAKWGGHFEAWKKTVELGKKLANVCQVTLHPPFLRPGQLSIFWRYAKTKDLSRNLEAGKLGISLENLPWPDTGPFGTDPMMELVKTCSQKGVNMTFDTCHLGVSGRDVMENWLKIPSQMVANIHFSDTDGIKEHLWPGTGRLDLTGFLQHLKETGYDGLLTLEVSPAAFESNNDDKIIAQLASWLEHARNILSKNQL